MRRGTASERLDEIARAARYVAAKRAQRDRRHDRIARLVVVAVMLLLGVIIA